jgi:urease accessory protein
MPTTLLEGLLSGLQHPAVGLDHLAFIVVLGVVAALTRAGTPLILAFVATAAIGTYARAVNFDYPFVEQLVSLSVLVAGLLIALGLGAKKVLWLPLALIAGLLHGYAFGEEVLGADRPVIAAYMLGVTVVCSAILLAVMFLSSKFLPDAGSRALRLAGAFVGVLGVVLLAQLLMNG